MTLQQEFLSHVATTLSDARTQARYTRSRSTLAVQARKYGITAKAFSREFPPQLTQWRGKPAR